MVSERPSQEGKLSAGAPNDPVPFGRYYLLGLIARGGMAEVYRARPRGTPEQILAVKCMRPQLAREARFIDMFHREGKLAIVDGWIEGGCLKHLELVDRVGGNVIGADEPGLAGIPGIRLLLRPTCSLASGCARVQTEHDQQSSRENGLESSHLCTPACILYPGIRNRSRETSGYRYCRDSYGCELTSSSR